MRELSLEGELAMPKGRRLGAAQIVTKLRQIEVLQGQGKNITAASKENGTKEQTQGRVPQWRDLLQLEVGPYHHRKLAQSLQYQAPTFCAWLSPAGTARDRTEARPSGHHQLISQCVWYKKSVRPIERSLRGLFHHSLDK